MTTPPDEAARLVAQALPLQVSPPVPGQPHPVWHVPDEQDPRRLHAVQALAVAVQRSPETFRAHLAAYQRQYENKYPQQPVQLTWSEGTPDPAALALAELVLETQPGR
ncbi:hypothetical protein [Deinococcus sp. YIM 77859]|uniref:hypothetical protein n=1 Tax=Deinococcus sp. YIM 77859 TaxID=1540221 RepID=UPI00054F2601|nr:hypothetical protein [Deinococcus sp. YIM 77859]